jgi:hypothetical protein
MPLLGIFFQKSFFFENIDGHIDNLKIQKPFLGFSPQKYFFRPKEIIFHEYVNVTGIITDILPVLLLVCRVELSI